MATSTFFTSFKTGPGAKLEGYSGHIYLVPSGSAVNGDMPLTEDTGRPGQYYRENVPDGEYKVYVDLDKSGSPVEGDLYKTPGGNAYFVWHGENKVSKVVANFNEDGTFKTKASNTTDGAQSKEDKARFDSIKINFDENDSDKIKATALKEDNYFLNSTRFNDLFPNQVRYIFKYMKFFFGANFTPFKTNGTLKKIWLKYLTLNNGGAITNVELWIEDASGTGVKACGYYQTTTHSVTTGLEKLTLTEASNSGISAEVIVNWDTITPGDYYSGMTVSQSELNPIMVYGNYYPKTISSVTTTKPDFINQIGVDAGGVYYRAIAYTGTMWEYLSDKLVENQTFSNNGKVSIVDRTYIAEEATLNGLNAWRKLFPYMEAAFDNGFNPYKTDGSIKKLYLKYLGLNYDGGIGTNVEFWIEGNDGVPVKACGYYSYGSGHSVPSSGYELLTLSKANYLSMKVLINWNAITTGTYYSGLANTILPLKLWMLYGLGGQSKIENNLFDSYKAGSTIGVSTEEKLKAIKLIKIRNAEHNCDYTIVSIARNHSTYGYKIVLTRSNASRLSWFGDCFATKNLSVPENTGGLTRVILNKSVSDPGYQRERDDFEVELLIDYSLLPNNSVTTFYSGGVPDYVISKQNVSYEDDYLMLRDLDEIAEPQETQALTNLAMLSHMDSSYTKLPKGTSEPAGLKIGEFWLDITGNANNPALRIKIA